MPASVYEIPGYSVPKELFESQKAQNQRTLNQLAKNQSANYQAANSQTTNGQTTSGQTTSGQSTRVTPTASAPRQTMVFTVEDFKKGVNISAQGGQSAALPSEGTAAMDAAAGDENLSPQGLNLRDPSSGSIAKIIDELPAGAYGRRYRPLDNGKLADASGKVKGLSDEQKISKLKQIKESAEEYEGFLIAEMIKSMRQSPFVKTPGGDTYSEIAEKPFTAALTKAGGLGLSQTIVNQVAAQEGLADALSEHPEVMGPHWRQRLAPSQMPKAAPKLGGQALTAGEPETKTNAAEISPAEGNLTEASPAEGTEATALEAETIAIEASAAQDSAAKD
ncbi:MAG: hypothetical protein LBF38_01550 [Deltaproteobacteria bacterium]|jgi:Rod binding domain-containing protein|nr:hypothetical protein [Deltaproteobacteria bacterium]